MWLGQPGIGFSTILIVLGGFVAATLAAELMSVFSNAIMTGPRPEGRAGRGFPVPAGPSAISADSRALALVAGFLVPMPGEAKTLLGIDPLLTSRQRAHQADRITGPFAAIWFAIFIIPFFLFVPDRRAAAPLAHPKRSAAAELWDTLKSLPSMPSLLIFLIARMLYTDGLTAIFAFGGIYGASVFGWGPLELGIFGIVLTLVGAFGALIGGGLDDRLGPKTVIVVRTTGVDRRRGRHSLGRQDAYPVHDGRCRENRRFKAVLGHRRTGVSWDLQFSSASSPRRCRRQAGRCWRAWHRAEKITQYFGLFAFSGKVTAFLAPFAVAFVTQETGSQRIGMSAVLAFLLVGVVMMLFVRTRRDRRPRSANAGSAACR